MKKTFLSIVMVIAITLSVSSIAFPGAIGSGHRMDMQETNHETEQGEPSDQGTSQEEVGSDLGTSQDAGSAQGICTGPADCPEQNETETPDNN